MSARRRLGQVRELAALQRAERDAASGDVADARARETVALAEAEIASARVGDIAARWYEATAAALLDPDTSAAIGRLLIQAETAADAGAQAADVATRRHDAAIDRWRGLDARDRATHRVAEDLGRRVARHREEAALATLADRTTASWRRR
ncbi:hypothetical protein [Sphingomonas sp.]|jgi:hypothetical protein|uniref:hypothetical protein n=1 Tax=Sphingomonas sp. TaxID=28214 RepID=UPI002E33E203|nr:hypothetical protein [Sphingomonas sp.]HEX4695795.1 hypothetical protein [Sphingomonas sp.]